MAPTPERVPHGPPTDSPNNPFGFFAKVQPRSGVKRAGTALGSKSKSLLQPRRDLSALGKPTLLFANYRAPLRDPRSKQESHPKGSNYASGGPSSNAHRLPPAPTEHRDTAHFSREVGLRKHNKRTLSQSSSPGDASEAHVAKRSRVPDDDLSSGSDGKEKFCPAKGSIPGNYTFASEIETHIMCCFPGLTAPHSLRHIVNPDRSWLNILGRDSFSGESTDFLLRGVEDPLAAGYIAGTIHQSLRMRRARLSLGRELTAEESEGLCQAVNRGAWSYAMKKIIPTAASAELHNHYQMVCNGIANAFGALGALGKRQMEEAGQATEKKTPAEQGEVATQTQTNADATVDADGTVDDSEPISLAGSSDNEDVLKSDMLVATRYAGIEAVFAPPAPRIASAGRPALENERLGSPIADSLRIGTESGDDMDEDCSDDEPHDGGDENYCEMVEDVETTYENGNWNEGGAGEADENYHDIGDDNDGGGVAGNIEDMGHGPSDGGANDPFPDAETSGSEAAAGAAVAIASGPELSGGHPELSSRAAEEPDQEEKENLTKEPPSSGFEVVDPLYVRENALYLVPSGAAFEEDGDAAGPKRDLNADSEDDRPMEGRDEAAWPGRKLKMDPEDDSWPVEEREEVDSEWDACPVKGRPPEFETGQRKNGGIDSEESSWPAKGRGKDVGKDPEGDSWAEGERGRAAGPLKCLEMAETDSESDAWRVEVPPRVELPPPEFEIYEDDDGQGEEDSGLRDEVAGSTPRPAGLRVLHPIDDADFRVRDAMKNGPILDFSPGNPFVLPRGNSF